MALIWNGDTVTRSGLPIKLLPPKHLSQTLVERAGADEALQALQLE